METVAKFIGSTLQSGSYLILQLVISGVKQAVDLTHAYSPKQLKAKETDRCWVSAEPDSMELIIEQAKIQFELQLLHDFERLLEMRDEDLGMPTSMELSTAPLFEACEHGNVAAVLEELERGVDINVKNEYGWTPLYTACNFNQLAVATLLMNHGSLPDYPASIMTPLHALCQNELEGHYVTQRLLEAGASVNKKDWMGQTPLYVACCYNNKGAAELLLQHGARIEAVERNGKTPLMVAAAKGNHEILRLLLDKNASVLAQDKNGMTALHLTCLGGHLEAAHMLIQAGARTDVHDHVQMIPLHVAGAYGHPELAALLAQYTSMGRGQENGCVVVPTVVAVAVASTSAAVAEQAATTSMPISQSRADDLVHDSPAESTRAVLGETPESLTSASNQDLPPVIGDVADGSLASGSELLLPVEDAGVSDQQLPGDGDLATDLAERSSAEGLAEGALAAILTEQSSEMTPSLFELQGSSSDRTEELPTPRSARFVDELGTDPDAASPKRNGTSSRKSTLSKVVLPVSVTALEKLGDQALEGREWRQSKEGAEEPLQSTPSMILEQRDSYVLEKTAWDNNPENKWLALVHAACREGKKEVAMQLLQVNKANISKVDEEGRTALHLASLHNDAVLMFLLLQQFKMHVSKPDKNGVTPLHVACSRGYLEVVDVLLLHNAVVSKFDKDGLTPLHCACRIGHVDLAKLLLERGAEVNKIDKDGVTPLLFASRTGNAALVTLLVEYGADVNKVDKNGVAPLHQAARSGSNDVTALLLQHKAALNKVDRFGMTPLHWSCHNTHTHVLLLLLENGAEVNKGEKCGFTALHLACRAGFKEGVVLLLEQKLLREKKDKWGMTALHWASAKGHNDVAAQLLRRNVSVSAVNKDGMTALHVASHNGHYDVVARLLRYGSYTRTVDKEGRTPLHWACYNGYKEAAAELLRAMVEVDRLDKYGKTAMQLAQDGGHKEVEQLLQEHKGTLLQRMSGRVAETQSSVNVVRAPMNSAPL